MIYARPGQTLQAWRAELAQALTLAGRHLSLYQLTIEPETPFAALHARGKLRVPDGEMAHDLYELTQELTQEAGLPAYEISNHAAPGEECRHNLTYWRYGEYAGIGPGAHGRVVVGGTRHATATERQPERWVQRVEADGHGMVERLPLTRAEQADEALLMGLRLSEGLDLDRLLAVSGMRPGLRAVSELLDLGLIERCGGSRLRATRSGQIVLNEVVLRLASALEPLERDRS
jgi:oxygen-independent coproporphyrinogen-3 oxidase